MDENDSLILRDGEQQELIPSTELDLPELTEEERRGIYTAERFFARDPEKYRACVTLLAEGKGQRKIAELLHVGVHTVRAVVRREAEVVATQKATVAAQYGYLAGRLIDSALEDVENPEKMAKTSVVQKMTAAAIATDKQQLLSGGATQRVEVGVRVPGEDAWDEYRRQCGAGAAHRTIDVTGEAESTLLTDREGENAPLKESGGFGAPTAPGLDLESRLEAVAAAAGGAEAPKALRRPTKGDLDVK